MKTNQRSLVFASVVLFLLFAATASVAQSSVKEKLAGIKGDVKKITISTASGDVVFEGDDAKSLLKSLKQKKEKTIKVVVDGDDMDLTEGCCEGDLDAVKILKLVGEGDSTNVFMLHDGDDDAIQVKKKVIVSEENGAKKVTVTTTKEGKDDVKVYEGKEADKYLDTMKKEGCDTKIWDEKDAKGKKMKKIIIKKEKKDND